MNLYTKLCKIHTIPHIEKSTIKIIVNFLTCYHHHHPSLLALLVKRSKFIDASKYS